MWAIAAGAVCVSANVIAETAATADTAR